ncbi:MAG TPA: alpha/beta fold hydrolase [Burkholderiaceae bacterium]|nr:alpha/beta fold hydrolase [Burkholderiaceae bacterium]
MLARLQQATTLGLLALAALWALVAVRAGQPAWAVGGALLIVFGYAIVLAVEFAILRAAHGDDPAPRATLAQIARAWAAEVVTAPRVFCWLQPFRSRRWPDRVEAGGAPRGVLLVHGFVCNRGVWNPWLARLAARGVPCIAVDLEPVFGSIDDYTPTIDAAVRRLEAATGAAPVIVAHSMGGLAVRRWWAEHADERVHHLITIATPHHGTVLARFALSPNTRQMRRASPWLQALAAREDPRRRARVTCFYSHCDNIVVPPSTAALAGADNRHLAGVAHVHMVGRDEPWQALLERLA